MFPNLNLLEQIQRRIKTIPNQRKESKRREHYCCFLLGYKAGLRVSEAINFDLNAKTKKGLYKIPTKGKKERLVAVSKEVISELKANNWQPHQTNRFNFYHFLRKIKRELEISQNIELTPHTLRRAFATYHAENGLPLPLLQKLLGHQSIRTTALYWMNIYGGDDSSSILIAKNWPERPKKPLIESNSPVKISLEPLPELFISSPPAREPHLDYLTKIKDLEKQLNQIQAENNSLKSELSWEREQNTNLQYNLTNLSHAKAQETAQKNQLKQDLTNAKETIQKLKQKLASVQKSLTNERNQRVTAESSLIQQRQNNQLLQETNANLTAQLVQSKQNQTNLLNTYQQAIKDKELAQKQANHYKQQLKTIARSVYQWQKLNYYQQQESNQFETKIVQVERPPPWKGGK